MYYLLNKYMVSPKPVTIFETLFFTNDLPD